MEHIMEVEHLQKSYGNVKAVKDVSFYVEPGKLFAFLGPNGAGKSTTINTICTFLKPDNGVVMVNGYRLGEEDDKIRDSIGTVFQENLLDSMLTVKENLELRGSCYGMTKTELSQAIERVAKATQIEEFLKRPYGKLSGGQKRRADIARALIHTPKILFLDEPTTGLDPQTRRNIWETVRRLQKENQMTIFLTTHYMEEAQNADYCIIVDDGKVAQKGTPFALKEQFAKDKLKLKWIDEKALAEVLQKANLPFTKRVDYLEVELKHTMQAMPILNLCQDVISGFEVRSGSMDDVFLNITGKEIRE